MQRRTLKGSRIDEILTRSFVAVIFFFWGVERERERKKKGEEKKRRGTSREGKKRKRKKKKNIGGESKKDSLNKRYELYKRINPLFNLTMETVGYTCTLINKWVKSNLIFRDHCRGRNKTKRGTFIEGGRKKIFFVFDNQVEIFFFRTNSETIA